jgi:cell division protein FtsZ
VNEAASIIQEVAHPDVNLIFGNVIDDTMGDEVRITVIAAGFERWDDKRGGGERRRASLGLSDEGGGEDDEFLDLEDDEFDVPSFLK